LRRIKQVNKMNFSDDMLKAEDSLNPKMPENFKYKWDLNEKNEVKNHPPTPPSTQSEAPAARKRPVPAAKKVRFTDPPDPFEVGGDSAGASDAEDARPAAPPASFLSDVIDDEDDDYDEEPYNSLADFEREMLQPIPEQPAWMRNLNSLVDKETTTMTPKPRTPPTPTPPTSDPAPVVKQRKKRRANKTSDDTQAEADDTADAIYSTRDATHLANHLLSRLSKINESIDGLDALDRLLTVTRNAAVELKRPLATYGALNALSSDAKIGADFEALRATIDRALAVVQVVRRSTSSNSTETQRQCHTLVALFTSVVKAYDIRSMPESRNDLVRAVYIPTHREDVLMRIAPPPLPTAAAVGPTILDECNVVRLVRADVTRREQTFVPSKRSNIINESMVRVHWNLSDTSLAWRLNRSIVAGNAIREMFARRRVGLVTGATPLTAALVVGGGDAGSHRASLLR
jgi:hypothetical protein